MRLLWRGLRRLAFWIDQACYYVALAFAAPFLMVGLFFSKVADYAHRRAQG